MDDLLALSGAEQNRAKRLDLYRAVAHLGTFAASVTGAFVPAPGPYLAALVVVVTEGVALVLRIRASGAHQLAERGRRHALIADALARSDAPERASLLTRYSSYAKKHAHKHVDPHYWASNLNPGPARLREHVQESAFRSQDLYKWAGRAGVTFVVVLVGVAALGVLVILGLDEGEVAVNAARIFAVLVLLVASLDFVGRSLAWFSGSGVSNDVVNAFDRPTTEELPAALSVFADYSVATATAPPIPDWIYRLRKDALNKAWQARSATST